MLFYKTCYYIHIWLGNKTLWFSFKMEVQADGLAYGLLDKELNYQWIIFYLCRGRLHFWQQKITLYGSCNLLLFYNLVVVEADCGSNSGFCSLMSSTSACNFLTNFIYLSVRCLETLHNLLETVDFPCSWRFSSEMQTQRICLSMLS